MYTTLILQLELSLLPLISTAFSNGNLSRAGLSNLGTSPFFLRLRGRSHRNTLRGARPREGILADKLRLLQLLIVIYDRNVFDR